MRVPRVLLLGGFLLLVLRTAWVGDDAASGLLASVTILDAGKEVNAQQCRTLWWDEILSGGPNPGQHYRRSNSGEVALVEYVISRTRRHLRRRAAVEGRVQAGERHAFRSCHVTFDPDGIFGRDKGQKSGQTYNSQKVPHSRCEWSSRCSSNHCSPLKCEPSKFAI